MVLSSAIALLCFASSQPAAAVSIDIDVTARVTDSSPGAGLLPPIFVDDMLSANFRIPGTAPPDLDVDVSGGEFDFVPDGGLMVQLPLLASSTAISDGARTEVIGAPRVVIDGSGLFAGIGFDLVLDLTLPTGLGLLDDFLFNAPSKLIDFIDGSLRLSSEADADFVADARVESVRVRLVPEPTAYGLVMAGFLVGWRRRRAAFSSAPVGRD